MSTELAHVGVKGMKWGVRKKPAPSGKTSKSTTSKKRQAFDSVTDVADVALNGYYAPPTRLGKLTVAVVLGVKFKSTLIAGKNLVQEMLL